MRCPGEAPLVGSKMPLASDLRPERGHQAGVYFHLRGFRFLYECRGETVLVEPLDFGFWCVPSSVPMGGVGFTPFWSNGSLTPLLPGFRSVDIVSFPC